MYKLLLVIILQIFSSYAYASQLNLPPIEIDVFSPNYNKEKDRYECNGSRLVSADNLNNVELFVLYQRYSSSAASNRKTIPYHEKVYTSMHNNFVKELNSDSDISVAVKNNGHLLVTLPFYKGVVWDQWLRRVATESNNIRMKTCKLEWYISQIERLDHIPMEFVKTYNSLLSAYEALVDRCKKPEIEGWTQSQEAKDYVNCRNNTWTREHNEKFRELKSYRKLRKAFVPILTELGLSDKLKSPRNEYLK